MSGAVLGVTLAAALSALSVAVALHARRQLGRLAPPTAARLIEGASESAGIASPSAEVVLSEIEVDRRGAWRKMDVLLVRFRSAARIALASGTLGALLGLAGGELERDLDRAIVSASVCFTLGAVGAAVIAQLGRAARADCRRFREEWNRREREATRLLSSAEWTDPEGAG